MADKYSIGAVIVTYNRVGELLKNLERTCGQTRRVDHVLVVDNNSEDGTREKIETLQSQYDNLHYINTGANTGGAGGFHAGVAWLLERSCDLLWLMDDDGRPDPDCLERLLAYIDIADVLGPLIYSDDLHAHAQHKVGELMTDELQLITSQETLPVVHPFNGTLLHRRVFEKIGNINKNLFIWGDEQDFRFRWKKAGFAELTVTAAKYFHPLNRLKIQRVYWLFKRPAIAGNRKYIFYRNQAFIDINSRPLITGWISLLRWLISILVVEPDKRKSLYGLFKGFIGDLREPHLR